MNRRPPQIVLVSGNGVNESYVLMLFVLEPICRCAAMFQDRDDICVPPVVARQTTERVLTMRFEPVDINPYFYD